MANNKRITIGLDFNVNSSQITQLKEQLKQIQLNASFAKDAGKITDELFQAAQAADKLEEALNKAWNNKLGQLDLSKLNKSIKESYGDLNKLKASLAGAGSQGTQAFNSFSKAVLNTNVQVKQTSKLLDSMATSMANTIKWGVTSAIFNNISNSVQRAWDYSVKLDTSLNDIRIITGKSADEMQRFADLANSAAKGLGTSTLDYTEAALIYYQQGLGDADVQARAQTTLRAANVTGQSGREVSEQLTAVWNGYKVQAAEAELYVDKLAAVAATTAADLEELSTGMSKVASAANTMGVDMDQLNAQLATIVSVTRQAPESVGTALKTIYARMSDIEAGIEESGVTLGNYTEKMSKMGVNVLNANGQLRDMGDVIEEIGSKWGSFSREQQIALAQIMAGTRQYNNLIALFDSWDMYEDALITSASAAGELQRQQDIYMESTEAHLQTLAAEAERTYQILFDETAVNTMTSAVTQLLSVFNNLLAGLGGGLNSFAFLGANTINLLSGKMAKSINRQVNNKNRERQEEDYQVLMRNLVQTTAGEGGGIVGYAVKSGAKQSIAENEEYFDFFYKNQKLMTEEEQNTFKQEIVNLELKKEELKIQQEYLANLEKIKNISLKKDKDIKDIEVEKLNEQSFKELLDDYDIKSYLEDYIVNYNAQIFSDASLVDPKELKNLEQKRRRAQRDQMSDLAKKLRSEDRHKDVDIYPFLEKVLKTSEPLTLEDFEPLFKAEEEKKALLKAIYKKYEGKDVREENKNLQVDIENDQTAMNVKVADKERERTYSAAITGLTSISSLLIGISGTWQTINNETLSFEQKISQVIPTLLATVPQFFMNLSNMKEIPSFFNSLLTSFGENVLKLEGFDASANKLKDTLKSFLGAEVHFGKAAGKGIEGVGKAAAGAGIKVGALLGWITLAIAAVTALGVAAYKAYNKDAIAAKKAEEAAKNVATVTNEAKTAYQELKDTFDGYEIGVKKLKELTKGTEDYKNALQDANSKAMQLIESNGSLAKYASRNSEGLIVFSGNEMETYMESEASRLTGLEAATIMSKVNANEARAVADFTETIRNNGALLRTIYEDREPGFGGAGDRYDGRQVIPYTLGNLQEPGWTTRDLNLYGYNNNLGYEGVEITKDGIENLVDYLVDQGGGMTRQDVENWLQIEQGIYDDRTNLVNHLMENSDVITKLTDSVIELNATNRLLTEEGMKHSLEKYDSYRQLEDAEKNAVATVLAKGFTEEEKETLRKDIHNDVYQDGAFGGGNEDQIHDEYAKIRGWTLVKNKAGDSADFMDKEGNIVNISDDEQRVVVENYRFQEQMSNYDAKTRDSIVASIPKFSQIGANIHDAFSTEILGLVTGGDLSLDEAYTNPEAMQALEEAISSGALTEMLKNISDGEWKSLKITEKELYRRLETARNNYDWSKGYFQFAEATKKIASEAKTILETISEEGSDEKLTEEQLQTLTKLENKYKELGSIRDRSSHEYLTTLRSIQEKEEYIAKDNYLKAFNSQTEDLNILLKEYDNLIAAGLQFDNKEVLDKVQEIEDKLQELAETRYQIKLQIDADLASDVDTAFDIASEYEQLRKSIKENLEYTYEEAQALINKGYGAMFENAERTTQGTIIANQMVVQDFIDGKKLQLQADAETHKGLLKNQKAALLAQKERLQQEITLLRGALETKDEVQAAETLMKVKSIDEEYQAENLKISEMLGDKAEAATEEENINSQLFTDLGGMYETNTTNQQQAEIDATNIQKEEIDKRIENARALYQAYVSVGNAVRASETGDTPEAFSAGSTQGGGTVSVTKAQTVEAKEVTTEGIDVNEDFKNRVQELFTNDNQTYKDTVEALLKQKEKELELVEGQIGARDAAEEVLDGALSTLDSFVANKGANGKKDNLDHIDRLESELDLYHDINIELGRIDKQLSQLKDQQDKLLGQDLINNLNEQFTLLQKQIEKTKDKIKDMTDEANTLKDDLGKKNVEFNKDGTIKNYTQAYNDALNYVNGLVDQYNAMTDKASQEAFKETVEAAKKEFEQFEEDLKRYAEIIEEEIPDLNEDIQNAFDEQIEIRIEKFNTEIEIRLEMAQAERDWNEFKKNVIDKIADDDILGNAKARLQDFHSYYKEGETEGAIEETTRHINDILFELGEMDRGIMSNFYGDNKAAAFEDLKKYYGQLMEDLTAVEELSKEVRQSYLDMMDKAQEDFNKQISKYEQITDLIDHDMKLIELLHGDKSYEAFGKYYEKQEKNYNQQLDFQKRQVDFWAAEMEAAKNDAERWAIAEENWSSAVTEWKSLINTTIENIQDKYLNTIKSIFEELNNKVTGDLGLEYVNEQWGLINRNAEEYLDAINAMYGIEDLQNKYLDAIDKTDSLSAQRKLNELMEQEVKALEEKDKLTQYDVDRAMKRYDIALKQIALEEAQQNKTSMRLKRDSQGNYSYQFTADEDAVRAAEDELAAAQNELYNFDKENYLNNLDEIYTAWEEYQEKMFEAAQINDPEERLAREKLLNEQYGMLINGLVEQNQNIRKNLYESAFEEYSYFYDKNLEDYLNMTQAQKDELMLGLIPQWESGVQHMADVFANEEDGFTTVCEDAMTKLSEATQTYNDDLEEIEKSAEITFETVVDGTDKTIDETEKLLEKNDELIESYEDELEAIQDVIDELDTLIDKFNNARDAAIEAAQAAYEYQQTTRGDFDADDFSDTPDYSRVMTDRVQSMAGTKNYKVSKDKYIKQTMEERQQKIDRDNTVTSVDNDRFLKVLEAYADPDNNKHNKAVELMGLVDSRQLDYTDETLKKYGFNTGGYTGVWTGEAGRLALLHQKELVLNAEDTKNILNAVQVLRTIDGSVLQRLASMSGTIGVPKGSLDATETIEQNVHIDAQFPNVTNSHEIENAFNNLINIASQRAFRKK